MSSNEELTAGDLARAYEARLIARATTEIRAERDAALARAEAAERALERREGPDWAAAVRSLQAAESRLAAAVELLRRWEELTSGGQGELVEDTRALLRTAPQAAEPEWESAAEYADRVHPAQAAEPHYAEQFGITFPVTAQAAEPACRGCEYGVCPKHPKPQPPAMPEGLRWDYLRGGVEIGLRLVTLADLRALLATQGLRIVSEAEARVLDAARLVVGSHDNGECSAALNDELAFRLDVLDGDDDALAELDRRESK